MIMIFKVNTNITLATGDMSPKSLNLILQG